MKFFIIMTLLVSSTVSFCSNGDFKKFIQCKRDIKKMRSTYVEVVLEDEPPLKDYLLRVFGLAEVQSWVLNSFYFRPWLSKVKISEKLNVCADLRSEMNKLFVEPIGIDNNERHGLNFSSEVANNSMSNSRNSMK